MQPPLIPAGVTTETPSSIAPQQLWSQLTPLQKDLFRQVLITISQHLVAISTGPVTSAPVTSEESVDES